jgi:hypothetical protein
MIVKGPEKKSFGVISITRVTVGCVRRMFHRHRNAAGTAVLPAADPVVQLAAPVVQLAAVDARLAS